jgi:hypothetical protein
MIRQESYKNGRIRNSAAASYIGHLYHIVMKCLFYKTASFEDNLHSLGRHQQMAALKKHMKFIRFQQKELQDAKLRFFKDNYSLFSHKEDKGYLRNHRSCISFDKINISL